MLNSFFSKWNPIVKNNYQQVLFVFLAFLLMILVAFFSFYYMARNQLTNSTNETLRTVEANIKTNLREPEGTLINSAFTIRNMLENDDASSEEVLSYMTGLTNYLTENIDRVSGFNGIYGLIQGEYLDGTGWEPPEDYVPQERPWYVAGKVGRGKAIPTDIYIDAQTQEAIISYAVEVRGNDNNLMGVIAIDVLINRITDYVCSLQLTKDGYGVLLNKDLTIIAHPDKDLIGIPLSRISKDYADIAERLKAGELINGVQVKDAHGVKRLVFFRKIYNGWYVAMLAPTKVYYHEMYVMEAIMITLGTILMIFLCIILLRLSEGKMRSEEHSRSKSSFLARMSHEIRTPMNAIIGMADLLLRKELHEEAKEDVIAIKQAGDNLLSIINDILDFSKIESGRLEIINKPYQFASLMNDVINIIRMRALEKDLLFLVNIDPNVPHTMLGDEVRLRQILLNLLGNAVKYTPEGHITLNVNADINGDIARLSFAIADTGMGIKEEDLPKLFSEFAQVDIKNNQGIEGTGLGLAITHNFCRLMQGEIKVVSEYGQGSVFTAVIPQKIVASIPFAVVEGAASHKVLIYETRLPYANSIAASLDDLGVLYTLALKEEEFKQALTTDKFTFIFIDYTLFSDAKKFLEAHGELTASLVLLLEIGKPVVLAGIKTMALPVYSLPLANMLNGIDEISYYLEGRDTNVRFTAPQAAILIVDDIATNLKVAQGLLSPYECHIDCVLSGQEAIDAVKKTTYDIVFMDHMMPEMDGIEATQIIRGMEGGRTGKVIIVALTANAVSGMKEMFLNNGFNDYLAKPIELAKLNEVMARWIPKEKQIKIGLPVKKEISAEKTLIISGVDIEKGLRMIGNSWSAYKEVLALYRKDVKEREKDLAEVPSRDNLPIFTTQVHALKSASASIGAQAVAEMAASLEDAAHKQNIDYIAQHLEGFRQDLFTLVDNINEALIRDKVSDNSEEAGQSPDTQALEKLIALFEQEDIGAIDALLAELMNTPSSSEYGEMLAAVSDYALISEFTEAIKLIQDFLGGEKNE